MRLDASDETLRLIRDVCHSAVNLGFAQRYASVHGPKAAIGKLYGKRVKSLASGNGAVVDRPIKLAGPRKAGEHRRRSSGRSGRSKRALAEYKPDPLPLHTAGLKKLGVIE